MGFVRGGGTTSGIGREGVEAWVHGRGFGELKIQILGRMRSGSSWNW